MALKISTNYLKIDFSKISITVFLFAVFASGAASGFQFAPVIMGNKNLPIKTGPTSQDKTPYPIANEEEVNPNTQPVASAQESNLPLFNQSYPPKKPPSPSASDKVSQTPASPPAASGPPANPGLPAQNDPPAAPPPAEEPPAPPPDPPPEDPPEEPPQDPL